MIKQTTETHNIPLDESDRVIELLKEALRNTDFDNFNSYIHNEWPMHSALTNKPKKTYEVRIGYKCNQ